MLDDDIDTQVGSDREMHVVIVAAMWASAVAVVAEVFMGYYRAHWSRLHT